MPESLMSGRKHVDKKKLWSFIKSSRFNGIFFRNLIRMFLCVIVPITLTYIPVYNTFYTVMEKYISDMNINSLNRIMDISEGMFKDAGTIAAKLFLENDVNFFMTSPHFGDGYTLQLKDRITNAISMYTLVYRHIDSIYVYSDKNRYLIANGGGGFIDGIYDNTWYQEFKDRPKDRTWITSRLKGNRYPYLISIVRPVNQYSAQQPGAIVVNIDVQKLDELLTNRNIKMSEDVFIVDQSGTVMYNRNPEMITKNIKELGIFQNIPMRKEVYSHIQSINGEKYSVTTLYLEEQGRTYISLIPMGYFGMMQNNLKVFVILIAASVFLVIAASFYISYKTLKPVRDIISIMDDPESWERINRQTRQRSPAEVNYIAENIMKTVYSNKQLSREIEYRISLLHKTQSAALQAQINPHFLYNTLETINFQVARVSGAHNEASAMISNLSDLLRFALESKSQLISLEQEIEHAKCYVEIMQVRYLHMLSVTWRIDESLMKYKVVKLSLQPVIENAIEHGIRPTRRKGGIVIEAAEEQEAICIKINDDGAGMSLEKAE